MEQNFIELFQAQVNKNPDTIAVVSENEQITYQELDLSSDRLAHY